MRSGVFYAIAAAVLLGSSTPFAKLLVGGIDPIAGRAPLSRFRLWPCYMASVSKPVWRQAERSQYQSNSASLASRGHYCWRHSRACSPHERPQDYSGFIRFAPAQSRGSLHCSACLDRVQRKLRPAYSLRNGGDYCRRFCLSFSGSKQFALHWGSLMIIGACLLWGIDNNLTGKCLRETLFKLQAQRAWLLVHKHFHSLLVGGLRLRSPLFQQCSWVFWGTGLASFASLSP